LRQANVGHVHTALCLLQIILQEANTANLKELSLHMFSLREGNELKMFENSMFKIFSSDIQIVTGLRKLYEEEIPN
jgi:hypothetical protein